MATYSLQPVVGGGVVDTMVMVGVASQASAAVGVPNDGVAGHSMVVFAGQVIVGEVLSSTVILCEQVLALFPQASLARQTRMATYSKQPVVGGGVVDTTVMVGIASQASAAVGVPNDGVAGHSMVVFAGQVIVGDVLSSTVMLCAQVALFPQSSVARHTRTATYSKQPVVGGGVVETMVMVTSGSQRSLATGVSNDGVCGHSMVLAGKQEIVGVELSKTVITCEQVAELPQTSVAR